MNNATCVLSTNKTELVRKETVIPLAEGTQSSILCPTIKDYNSSRVKIHLGPFLDVIKIIIERSYKREYL